MYVTTYEQSKRSLLRFFYLIPPLTPTAENSFHLLASPCLWLVLNFSDKLSDSSNKLTYKSDIA